MTQINIITTEFREACDFADVKATRRQVSKYRNKYGSLWNKVGGDLYAYVTAEKRRREASEKALYADRNAEGGAQ